MAGAKSERMTYEYHDVVYDVQGDPSAPFLLQLTLQQLSVDRSRLAGSEGMHARFPVAREGDEHTSPRLMNGGRHVAAGAVEVVAVIHSPELAVAADEELVAPSSADAMAA